MKQKIGCPCGRNFQIEFEDEIDLDSKQDTIDKINDGSFMSFVCPGCEKKHKPEYRIMIKWKSKDLKMEVLPELERGAFYMKKNDKVKYETIIGYPEMADRIAVIKDDLDPVVIEALKYFLYMKAEETYPDSDINIWYHGIGPEGIEFHLTGIRDDEVAVMRIPQGIYDNTKQDYRKSPKKETYTSLRCRSYLSVQNVFRADALK